MCAVEGHDFLLDADSLERVYDKLVDALPRQVRMFDGLEVSILWMEIEVKRVGFWKTTAILADDVSGLGSSRI